MNDHDAEDLARAVSNSDSLALPANPKKALEAMERVLRPIRKEPEVYTGESLGYTRMSLKGYKMGTPKRKIDGKRLKRDRNQQIIDLHKSAVSKTIIADMIGISIERVTQIINRGY